MKARIASPALRTAFGWDVRLAFANARFWTSGDYIQARGPWSFFRCVLLCVEVMRMAARTCGLGRLAVAERSQERGAALMCTTRGLEGVYDTLRVGDLGCMTRTVSCAVCAPQAQRIRARANTHFRRALSQVAVYVCRHTRAVRGRAIHTRQPPHGTQRTPRPPSGAEPATAHRATNRGGFLYGRTACVRRRWTRS
jgi:hypothetical protein